MQEFRQDDPRWGGQLPWFLRHSDFESKGNFHQFLTLLEARLDQFFHHNEMKFDYSRLDYLLRCFLVDLKNKTFHKFTFYDGGSDRQNYVRSLVGFFSPTSFGIRTLRRVPEQKTRPIRSTTDSFVLSQEHPKEFVEELRETLFILEVLLQKIKACPNSDQFFPTLLIDLRRDLVYCYLLLDISDNPVQIIPLEEPLFQNEVLGRLLPRLQVKFPDEANNLVKAYHSLLAGADTNQIFGNAFKSLEIIARSLSGNPSLLLSNKDQVQIAFPYLHPTTKKTILNLAAHRGDEGGHGGKAPPMNQLRYLLLHICNIALLLLESNENATSPKN